MVRRVRLYQSTHLAVAVAGVGASLPGAVAPYEFAFVGLVEGFGGDVVVGGTHGSGGGLDPLLDESSGIGDMDRYCDPQSQWCTSLSIFLCMGVRGRG